MPEEAQRPAVLRDAVILAVPVKLTARGFRLLPERSVSITAEPVTDRLNRPRQAALGRLALHHEYTAPRFAPVESSWSSFKNPPECVSWGPLDTSIQTD